MHNACTYFCSVAIDNIYACMVAKLICMATHIVLCKYPSGSYV